ncbi:hypothetical protein PoB_007053200 [Plakobranchus ocellatus]|uniref:Uncharacterized protein n=1 Tax=Plakobranchus ocellatus TaxID=259542 RepID=A0AAV4DIE2_9GAST|nr:hypothetical protein PoB_007053200 [Plakobranchus ocellatus]
MSRTKTGVFTGFYHQEIPRYKTGELRVEETKDKGRIGGWTALQNHLLGKVVQGQRKEATLLVYEGRSRPSPLPVRAQISPSQK